MFNNNKQDCFVSVIEVMNKIILVPYYFLGKNAAYMLTSRAVRKWLFVYTTFVFIFYFSNFCYNCEPLYLWLHYFLMVYSPSLFYLLTIMLKLVISDNQHQNQHTAVTKRMKYKRHQKAEAKGFQCAKQDSKFEQKSFFKNQGLASSLLCQVKQTITSALTENNKTRFKTNKSLLVAMQQSVRIAKNHNTKISVPEKIIGNQVRVVTDGSDYMMS